MTTIKKTIAGFVGFAIALSLVAVSPAQAAMTSAELASQIAALQAQLAALSGGTTTTSSSSYSFTRDLTIGSTGADVTALQSWLISKGFSIPAGATGYFGTQTQAAVSAYQAARGISPTAGYFGPTTRARVASEGGSTTTTTTGGTTTTTTTTDTTLSGGAGSIKDADFISSISNEEVGEDAEEVDVLGLEIEADEGSDIQLTAVTLDFGQGTATNDDLDEFATEVTIMLDGEKVASIDAGEFEEDDSWSKTISLDSGAVIKADSKGKLTVALSGVSNLDTNDEGDTWNVEVEAIRFKDASGATITDNSTGDINGVTRTFSFETFASASDVELKADDGDEKINNAHIVNVDDSDDTDDVELFSFTLEAEGDSDVLIDELPVNIDVTGASHVDDLVSSVTLYADGEEIGSENLGTDVGTDETVTFDDLDFTISAGKTVDFIVKADFNATDSDLDEGDTIAVQLSGTEVDAIDAEDESGESLSASELTGTATGEAHAVYDVGIKVTLKEVEEKIVAESTGSDNDAGQFTITYLVEAFDGAVYVSDSAAATADVGEDGLDESIVPSSGGVVYVVDEAGTATTTGISSFVSFKTNKGTVTDTGVTNGVRINDGSIAEFTLTVTRTNAGPDNDGIFRVLLDGIGWATSDTTPMNAYDFDLSDFKTDPLYID